MPHSEWSDRTKFTAETIRTIALAAVGSYLVLLLVKPLEKEIDYKAQVASTRLAISAKIADEFLSHSYKYVSTASDVCKGSTKLFEELTTDRIDRYRSAKIRLELYFREVPRVVGEAAKIEPIIDEFWSECKRGPANREKWQPLLYALDEINRSIGREALQSLGL